METNWLYAMNGQQHGPISAARLKQLADDGGIGPDDLVCQQGSSNWVPAKQVNGLFSQPTTGESTGPSSPPPLLPPAQPAATSDVLPQIQVKVSETLRGIGNAVQGVAGSKPVKAAGESLKNAAGQAVAGVGDFIRSDAVQTQVKAASNVWSNLTTQNKLLAAGIGGLGLLMMSCCMCGMLGMMFGRPSPSSTQTTEVDRSSSPPNDKQSAYSNLPQAESESSIENRERIEERLNGLTHIDLTKRYGDPTRILNDPTKANSKYYVWKIGSKDTELFVIQWVLFQTDRSGRSIDAQPLVFTSDGLERAIRKLNLE
jgi:hypothetical protein